MSTFDNGIFNYTIIDVSNVVLNFLTDRSTDPYPSIIDMIIPNIVSYESNDYFVMRIGANAFTGNTNLVGTLIIPDSVMVIDNNAFFNTGITSVSIPESITSIGTSVFAGCVLLNSFTISPSIIVSTIIASTIFTGCTILTSVTLGLGTNTSESISQDQRGYLYVIAPLITHINFGTNITSIDATFRFTPLTTITFEPESTLVSICDNAFLYRGLNCPLILPSSLVSIGASAFARNNFTGDLIIPDSVTYLGISAFSVAGFTGTLTIGTGITHIEESALEWCGFTGSLVIPDNITYIDTNAFRWCHYLTGSITLSINLTYIGDSAFSSSDFRGTLIIPETVTYIGNGAFGHAMFSGSIVIPNSVTYLGDQGVGRPGLFTSVTIGNSVTHIGNSVFEGSVLTEIIIPASVITIGNRTFYGCANLTVMTIPDSVITIGISVFELCTQMTSIIFGSSVTACSLTSIGNKAFYTCSSLVGDLIIPNNVLSIGDYAFSGTGYSYGGEHNWQTTKFVSLVIGSSVTSIGDYAFYFCDSLVGNLIIPDSVISIGEGAFSRCRFFNGTLAIGNSVTSIPNYAFEGCPFIGSLVISNNILTIGKGAFGGGKYTNLTIGNSVTYIGKAAFQSCDFTGDLVIPNSVITIGNYAFQNCNKFNGTLTIGTSVQSIGEPEWWNGYVFRGCTGFIGSLVIPASVTYIGNETFSNCSGFTGNLVIPDNIPIINKNVFQGCTGFNGTLTISNTATSIGDYAFQNCSGLTGDLLIPNSVTSIASYAFQNCIGFTDTLTIGNSVTYIGDYAFQNCPLSIIIIENPTIITTITILSFTDVSNNLNSSITLSGIDSLDELSPTLQSTWTTISGYYVISPVNPLPIASICFVAGTPINTDQGIVDIDKIDINIHTISDKKIVAITTTVTYDKYLICFDKNAFDDNVPSQQTIISEKHLVLYKGNMSKSKDLLDKVKGVNRIKYVGEILYNVLLETCGNITVNNLICETLQPRNKIAKLYIMLNESSITEHSKLILNYNNHILTNRKISIE